MEKYTIKELGEFINAINKKPDATIELTVDRAGGVAGAFAGNAGLILKITPTERPANCKGADKCKKTKSE